MNAVDFRPVKLAWVGLVSTLVLLIGVISFALGSKCLALTPAAIAAVALLGTAVLSLTKLALARRQVLERENLALYRDEHPGAELFEDSDEALKMASRAHNAYTRFVAPTLAVLLGVLTIALAIMAWGRWQDAGVFLEIRNPLQFAVLSYGMFVLAALLGSYFVGLSREPGHRWLRPTGAWMFCFGALMLSAGLSLTLIYLDIDIRTLDLRVARLGLIAVIVLGAELVLNVVIEFYRPRSMYDEERPVFESRLLALLTEPGGIARNVAASLDYQFGFKVSEAWFYRFVERAVIPCVIAMGLLFWLMTCFVVVQTEENGIRERFGRVVQRQPLGPGLYLKLPWPLARIYTFPVHRVQMIPIGYQLHDAHADEPSAMPEDPSEEMGDLTGGTIVWSKKHHAEEINFVVANRPEALNIDLAVETDVRAPVSVYLLVVSIPLYYTVEDLYVYEYQNENPQETLKFLAYEEVVRYLASADFFTILARGRQAGGEVLRQRIQEVADRQQLGVRIVFVGLQGLHPPVRVGSDFNAVVSAMQERHTRVLEADRYAMSRRPKAEAEAVMLTSAARQYHYEETLVPAAEAERFKHQLAGFVRAPELFVLRNFLDVLQETTATTRKYVVATRQGQEVVVVNLEEKLRSDLLDVDLERED